MPKEQEAKARSQPNKGLPSVKKHHQVQPKPPQAGPPCSQTPSSSIHGVRLPQLHCPQRSQASRNKSTQTDRPKLRQALPGSSATSERRDPLPALPPLPRQAATLRATPWHSVGASNIPRLPSLPVAGSTSSVPCRDRITSTKAVRLPEVVPRPQGHVRKEQMAATAESWGTALHAPTSILAPLQARPEQDNRLTPSHAADRSQRLRVQLRVQRHYAPPSSLATPARTAQVPATKTEKRPTTQRRKDGHAREDTRAAAGTSKPCSLAAAPGPAAQADSIACRPQGKTPHRGDVAQYQAVLDSETEHLEELESTAAGPSREEQRDLTQEEEQSDAATKDPSGGRQQKEATSNLHWDPDAAHQQGPGSPHSTGRDSAREAVSHAQSASFAMSGPTNAEPEDAAQVAGPDSEGDKNPMGASAPRDANSPSPLPAAMPSPSTNNQERPSTLQDRVKIDWDIYGCSSFRPAMQTIPSGEREGRRLSWWNVSWPSSVRIPRLRWVGAADNGGTADSNAPSASGRQEVAVRTAGQRLPYLCPTSSKSTLHNVQEEWEESPKRAAVAEADSIPPSTSPASSGEADAGPSGTTMAAVPGLEELPPACMPKDGKSSASPLPAAMPSPSTRSQQRQSTLQDRVKIDWDIYGCSSFRPAMQTIPSGEREGRQLSWWNVSWPSSVRIPRLQWVGAADNGGTADSNAPSASGRQEVAVRTAGQRLPYLCPTSSKSTLHNVQEEWEESPKRAAVAEADSIPPSTSPASSGEADAGPSGTTMAAVPGPEELPPACMPKDGKSSASPLPAAMPSPSTSSQQRQSTLQVRVKIDWDIYGCSSFRPAMQTILSGEREGRRLSWWNVSWPSSVRIPRLRWVGAADNGGTADSNAPSASGRQEVAVRTAGQRLPYLCPTSSKSTLHNVQEEWEESPKRAAVAEADSIPPSTSPASSGEADAGPSGTTMAAVPGLEELPPACMPKDGKSSASPLPAAMPSPSTSSQQRQSTLQDRVKIDWDIYGCSSFRPAMQTIPSGEREGRQLSWWNVSWPSSVRIPRLQWVGAADNGGTADSNAPSASGRQEVAVRTAGQRLPYLCPTSSKSTLHNVQEEWEESPKRAAVAEADSIPPSTSPASSGEADAGPSGTPMAAVPGPEELPPACMPEDGKSSASPLAADPVLEARTAPLTPSACEEEEAAPSPLAGGLLQEVSSEHRSSAQRSSHFQSVPEEGPGTAALPHAVARSRLPRLFRVAFRAFRALRRSFCISGITEDLEQREADSTRELPTDGSFGPEDGASE
ncbi:uncharacterized protein [Anas platyrhynchos]|uniref:uncharacterized protein isoform X2 n=1 Tax=Anas platyrhynchos TaxID=8839 RepID=UPI003AF2130E